VSGVVVKPEPVRKGSPDRKDAFVIHDARQVNIFFPQAVLLLFEKKF